jgi:hypothetical protein
VKELSEIHVCVIDAGTFVPLAEMMARKTALTSYYSPFEQEYLGVERCVIGDGMPTYNRVDEYMDPDFFNSVDLWIFPDIGFGGFQRYLRSLGKLVFGSMGASDLELYRTKFLKVIEEVGLPVVHSETVVGVTALREYLSGVERKWIKINRFRDNMETWFHIDITHSERELERLAITFGPLKDLVTFIVQDAIEGEEDSPVLEIGYDGWCIDGNYPSRSYSGYEKKNELYLGSEMADVDLPEPVRRINAAMAPVLAEYGYRNFLATEIRQKNGVPYYIDPTPRMAGQTMEHLLETCTNLPEVVYAGAQGQVIDPDFRSPYAVEATLHYKSNGDGSEWKTLRVPEEVAAAVKLYRCCFANGAYQFPPHKSDELGVITGDGETVEAAIDNLKEHFEALKNEPVSIEVAGFADLLKQIQDAEKEGVEFSDQPIPEPETVLGS